MKRNLWNVAAATILVTVATSPCDAAEIHDATARGDLEAIEQILKKDPKAIKSVNSNGQAPLHLAVQTGRKDVLEALVKDESLLETLFVWLSIVEEFFKILAEGLFIIAFWHCRHLVRFERA